MSAEILSYSRNKGLFAGVSLEGSTLRSDGSANEKLYGQKLTAKEIIRERQSQHSARARRTGLAARHQVAGKQIGSEIAGIAEVVAPVSRETL